MLTHYFNKLKNDVYSKNYAAVKQDLLYTGAEYLKAPRRVPVSKGKTTDTLDHQKLTPLELNKIEAKNGQPQDLGWYAANAYVYTNVAAYVEVVGAMMAVGVALWADYKTDPANLTQSQQNKLVSSYVNKVDASTTTTAAQ